MYRDSCFPPYTSVYIRIGPTLLLLLVKCNYQAHLYELCPALRVYIATVESACIKLSLLLLLLLHTSSRIRWERAGFWRIYASQTFDVLYFELSIVRMFLLIEQESCLNVKSDDTA